MHINSDAAEKPRSSGKTPDAVTQLLLLLLLLRSACKTAKTISRRQSESSRECWHHLVLPVRL